MDDEEGVFDCAEWANSSSNFTVKNTQIYPYKSNLNKETVESTCEDGLVHSQGGGLNRGQPDVGWNFVTN